ncbi:peptidoglycan DD-metalloendopeptidase family protein [Flavisphingomonas formosensis]|uniref:peptidoglycan DD-metalloendopeptidase family protein n=1 Tax=Flavisphingomonas formosensis TaxID=861534 RepID=UPI0012FA8DEC|nr:peptidoglycan DD-metalloendopeptidase family protein [Sphingomonas formosensis]
MRPYARLALILPLFLAACIPNMDRPAKAPRPGKGRPLPTAPAPRLEVVAPDIPESIPSWRAQAVEPDAVEIASSVYTVKAGDSLRSISNKTGAASEAIARVNNIPPPFVIHTGQKLKIPGGRYHLVRAGQSGIAIARAYGVDWSQVATMNQLEEPYILRTGQRLLLPSKAEVSSMTVEQRAAAFRIDIDDLITGGEPALASNEKTVKPVETPKRVLAPSVAVGEPPRFAGQFVWPLNGKILTSFGSKGNGIVSNGLDIAADRGAPIRAAADGIVAYVGTEVAGLGGLVLIRHGDGWITAYGHADAIGVSRGQAVKQGQVIARAGDDGTSDTPRLHFEMRQKRLPVDPMKYLPRS